MLATGISSVRDIARDFECGSYMAVHRHKVNHLGKRIIDAVIRRDKAVTEREKADADEFLDGIQAAVSDMSKGVSFGMKALASGEISNEMAFRMAPAFAGQQLKALELLGRATGRLDAPDAAQQQPFVLQLNIGGNVSLEQPSSTLEPGDECTIDVKAITST